MRTLILSLAVAVLVLAPPASASATYNSVLPAVTPLQGAPLPFSTPLFQSSQLYGIVAGPGDTIAATATWADTSGFAVQNDIDLTLQLPSAGPQPVDLSSADAVVTTALGVVAVRVARQTCTDAAAEGQNHGALGDAQGTETLSFTVPSGGESGKYVLLVRGFVLTTDQPYSLTITVTSGASDVTASRVVPALTGLPIGGQSTFITTNPYCELI